MVKTLLTSAFVNGGASTTASTTEYWFLSGHLIKNTLEVNRDTLIRSAGTLSNLWARVQTNATSATSTIRTRDNATNGGQTITVGIAATGTFEDTTGTDTVSAGDKLCIQTITGAGGAINFREMSTIFDATTDTVSILATTSDFIATAASTTYYLPIQGYNGNLTTTETFQKCEIRKSFTAKNMAVYVTTARATASTVKSRKNGADGNLVVTCTGATTGWYEDTTHTDTLVATDDYDYSVTTGTGADSLNIQIIKCEYVSTTGDGLSFIGRGAGTAITDATTTYYPIGGTCDATATESANQTKARAAFDLSNLVVMVSQNGITAASTFDLRKGAASTTITISITASTTGVFQDTTHTETIAATDLINFRLVATSVAGSQTITLTNAGIATHITSGANYTTTLPTETVTISESVTRLYTANRAPATETTTIGETIARVATNSRSLATETVTVGESLARVYGVVRPLATETITVGESLVRLLSANRAQATETVTSSESLARQFVGNRPLSTETTAISETLATLKTIVRPLATETVTIGETLARTLGFNRALATQTTTIGESVARLYAATRTIPTETVTVGAESLTILKTIVRALATETVTVGESLVRAFNGVRLLPAETVTVGTGTLARVYNAMRALSTETITIAGESLTRLYNSMRALATETVTVTGGTIARLLAASRQIATETVTISETLLRQFVGQRLLATQTTAISDSVASLYTPAPAAGTFERQMPLENVAITETLNRVVTNSRTLIPEITAISDSITRVFGTTRTIPTQTTAISESLLRTYSSTRAIPTQVVNITDSINRLCNTARLLPTEITPVTESLLRTYSGIRTSIETIAITESLAILITPVVIIPSIWRITGQNTDFPDSLENIITAYIKSNWSITDPVIGQTPLITSASVNQHQTQVDNFAYDNFRTYYIRVKEISSGVKNRQVRLNTYEFETPIDLELYARRLTKGESFSELNAMVNELLRIFGTYQQDTLFGIQGISLGAITSMEKERPPAQNTWARKLRIVLHYYRMSIVG